jgi:A/G-specific adenine glycosylase
MKEKAAAGKAKTAETGFATALLRWNELENDRELPWKGEKDPYRIWLSEVILQQTRAEQGRAYYERFVEAFPAVSALAKAPEQQVMKLWEGMGYYSRARNLMVTARRITDEFGGKFPPDIVEIQSLKGIGPYTAAAIASFAWNLPHAVVDGNVYRVLARIFNNDIPIDSTEGKRWFAARAQELLPENKAAAYNQALMDFGATLCKPLPECGRCFYKNKCGAFLAGRQGELPVKSKKAAPKERWFHYVLLQSGHKLAIRLRSGKDIWRELWEPLMFEADIELETGAILQTLEAEYGIIASDFEIISSEGRAKQRLTHQLIRFSFLHLHLTRHPQMPGFDWIPVRELHRFAFPKTVGDFIRKTL